MTLLHVENMTHYFGGLRAVHRYNLEIDAGQIRGLIGPNGAGKSTVFNLITGLYTPTEGDIRLEGKSLLGLKPHQIASMGLGRTFQNMQLWRHMTVLDHVKMARYSKLQYGLYGAFFGTAARHREEAESEEMARALATEPKVLFLDEPTAGMNPEELGRMVAVIRRVHEELGLAILLIEHRLRVVMELCETIQTLVFGEIIAEGTPDEIRNNPAVIDAYLGKDVVE
ncbi:MAG: ABC transporter ATP-binding protein [Deltaproteobacteria bacterium]|nr:ABC transporter ATP-binding protein [Deltaproteobacteria bacterium]